MYHVYVDPLGYVNWSIVTRIHHQWNTKQGVMATDCCYCGEIAMTILDN